MPPSPRRESTRYRSPRTRPSIRSCALPCGAAGVCGADMREPAVGYHGGGVDRERGPDDVPRIVVLNGAGEGAVFALPEIPTVAGRPPESHLQIADPWISSMHALFERRGDEIWVVDLDSRNGTFVGDARVGEARLGDGA